MNGPGPVPTTANSLRSATTVVDVAAATAPSAGQVLTAVDSTHATWQASASGGVTGTGTVNTLPKVVNATGPVIGDSSLKDDGTQVNTTEKLATIPLLGTIATWIKTTAQRSPALVVAVNAFTAGKFNLFIEGIVSA